MGLKEDIAPFREVETGMIGLVPQPGNHSTDNGLLFSATYLMLLEKHKDPAIALEILWFMELTRKCRIEPGLFVRYPGDRGMQAHDDMIGLAFCSDILAAEMLAYGRAHTYTWNTEHPGVKTLRTFFARIGGFYPFLKARAGEKLNFFDQMNVVAAYLYNLREDRGQTSGRCLLYLMAPALDQGWFAKKAIAKWRTSMMKMFPGGVQELYSIYFQHPDHPFRKYAPKDFS